MHLCEEEKIDADHYWFKGLTQFSIVHLLTHSPADVVFFCSNSNELFLLSVEETGAKHSRGDVKSYLAQTFFTIKTTTLFVKQFSYLRIQSWV